MVNEIFFFSYDFGLPKFQIGEKKIKELFSTLPKYLKIGTRYTQEKI